MIKITKKKLDVTIYWGIYDKETKKVLVPNTGLMEVSNCGNFARILSPEFKGVRTARVYYTTRNSEVLRPALTFNELKELQKIAVFERGQTRLKHGGSIVLDIEHTMGYFDLPAKQYVPVEGDYIVYNSGERVTLKNGRPIYLQEIYRIGPNDPWEPMVPYVPKKKR